MVNDAILAGSPLSPRNEHDDAKKKGAMALFGEKYGQTVRVVQAFDSIELLRAVRIWTTLAKAGSLKIIGEACCSRRAP